MERLTFDQIQPLVTGAVTVKQTEKGIRFFRFTEQQYALYEQKNDKFFLKSQSASGIKISLKTNSDKLFVHFFVEQDVGASFLSFDIFVNGRMIESLNNFEGVDLPRSYLKMEFPLGEFSRRINLEEGEKTVVIHLPWNVIVYLKEISVADGAWIKPFKPAKRLLAMGDSITYGNAAMHPSNRYIARLCDKLDAEEYNKGIGGEFFYPELALAKDSFNPDYIVIAYGTNDWRKLPKNVFLKNVTAFFRNLNKTYPDTKTIVITPTWRSNLHVQTDFTSIREVHEAIRRACADRPNTIVVDGFDLVPHDVVFFGDYGCHPNDTGFSHYFENLWKAIEDWI